MDDREDDVLGLRRGEVRLAEPTARWATLYAAEARRLEAALESGLTAYTYLDDAPLD